MLADGDHASEPRRIGRYEILRELGAGGMARTFVGRAVGPGGVGKTVCIKVIRPGAALDPRAIERFSAEARTSLALQHANVVPVFDYGRDGDAFFLVMEWIDGCDLGALLASHRAAGTTLPELLAVFIACEVARALAYAHDRRDAGGADGGVLHCDVTPGNILLSRQGEVRLADFGIARASGAAQKQARPAGTPRYMAPEQARGEALGPTADIFALGLVWAEMLTGQRIRTSDALADAAQPLATEALAGVPAPYRALARAMTAAVADDRPASASEVERRLVTWLAESTLRGDQPPSRALAMAVAVAAPARADAPPADAEAHTIAPPTIAAATGDGATDGAAPATNEPSGAAPAVGPRMAQRRLLAIVGVGLLGATAIVGALVTRSDPTPLTSPPPPSAGHPSSPTPAPRATPVANRTQPTTPDPATRRPTDPAPVPTPAAPARATAPVPTRSDQQATARLKITVPGSWAHVFVDGKKLGEAPGTFVIPSGRHTLRAENAPLHFAERRIIDAAPGQTVAIEFSVRH